MLAGDGVVKRARGRRVGQGRADDEQLVLELPRARPSAAESKPCARTSPSTAFSSSTVPYASIRTSSLGTRRLAQEPRHPSSPVLV